MIGSKKGKHQKIKEIFIENDGFARTKDIAGKVHPRYLYDLVEEGTIEKVKRGLYFWPKENYSTDQELLKVAQIVPDGVLCLLSALSFYELTTVNPWKYHVAVHRDAHKPTLPEYPPIELFYFSETQYEVGMKEVEIDGGTINIYDPEKTICDCVRYRKKIGQDIVKEALREYVNSRERNIDKLIQSARETRISGLIKQYLEVLA